MCSGNIWDYTLLTGVGESKQGGGYYQIREHLFGRSDHLFVAFAHLFAFAEQRRCHACKEDRLWVMFVVL